MINWIRRLLSKAPESLQDKSPPQATIGPPGMHASSRDEIDVWFETGVARGATHLIVVLDTFDYDDYPVYVSPAASVRDKFEHYNGKTMQEVIEVYNLSMDKATQLAEHRAFHF